MVPHTTTDTAAAAKKNSVPAVVVTAAETAMAEALAGMMGTLLSLWCFYPLEQLKMNIQAGLTAGDTRSTNRKSKSETSSPLPLPSSSLPAVTTVVTTTVTGLITTARNWRRNGTWYRGNAQQYYRGCGVKSMHALTSSFCYFYLSSWLVHRYHQHRHHNTKNNQDSNNNNNTLPPTTRLLLAALAAMLNTFLTLPLDVIAAQRITATTKAAATTPADPSGSSAGTISTTTLSTRPSPPGSTSTMTIQTKTTTKTRDSSTNTRSMSPIKNEHYRRRWKEQQHHQQQQQNRTMEEDPAEIRIRAQELLVRSNSSSGRSSRNHRHGSIDPEKNEDDSNEDADLEPHHSTHRDETTNDLPSRTTISYDTESDSDSDHDCGGIPPQQLFGSTNKTPTNNKDEDHNNNNSTDCPVHCTRNGNRRDTSRSSTTTTSMRNRMWTILRRWSKLWKGLVPALLLCTNPAIHYTVYDVCKAQVVQYKRTRTTKQTPQSLSVTEAFLVGLVAKFVATILTYPLIRAKILLMLERDDDDDERENEEDPKRRNRATIVRPSSSSSSIRALLCVLQRMYATQNAGVVHGLYKGCAWQLLHTVLKSALMMTIRERLHARSREGVHALVQCVAWKRPERLV